MPWLTCTARREYRSSGASSSRIESSATESTPPERPSARCEPGASAGASDAATLTARSLELGFLELAIAHQALEALLDEFLRVLVAELAQCVGERLFQVLGRRRRIAMGGA